MIIDGDTLVAYALGTLSPEAELEVEVYLEAQPGAAAVVSGYQDALSELVMTLTPVPQPASAVEALLSEIRADSKTPAWRWGLGLGLAAKAAAALWLLGQAPPAEVRKEFEAYRSRPGAVADPLLDVRGQTVGDVVRLPDRRLFVAFDSLPAEGQVFHAWEVVGGVPQLLGVWYGHTFFTERPLALGSTFAVSLEPAERSFPTREPVVLIPL